jgi:hypothetical protein
LDFEILQNIFRALGFIFLILWEQITGQHTPVETPSSLRDQQIHLMTVAEPMDWSDSAKEHLCPDEAKSLRIALRSGYAFLCKDKSGELNGPWVGFDEAGQPQSRGEYRNGLPTGEWLAFCIPDL